MSTWPLRMRWAGALIALCACSPAHGGGAESRAPALQGARAVEPSKLASNDAAGAHGSTAHVVLMPPGRDQISVRVEIARTEDERRRGLMFRTQLDDDAGMIFLFERPQHLVFWMRNTEVPLDMIFIEPSLRVLGVVENAEPRTDSSRSVSGDSQYVLEVNAGFSRRHGLGPGTAVRFEGVTPAP